MVELYASVAWKLSWELGITVNLNMWYTISMYYEEAIKRRKKVVMMRNNKKMTYRQIGEAFGMTKQWAQKTINTPPSKKGKTNPFWVGKPKWMSCGRDRSRELVRERDGHKCRECGKSRTNRRLDVHHIHGMCGKKSRKYDPISDMELLITLCHKCHFNRHDHTYGRKS